MTQGVQADHVGDPNVQMEEADAAPLQVPESTSELTVTGTTSKLV